MSRRETAIHPMVWALWLATIAFSLAAIILISIGCNTGQQPTADAGSPSAFLITLGE